MCPCACCSCTQHIQVGTQLKQEIKIVEADLMRAFGKAEDVCERSASNETPQLSLEPKSLYALLTLECTDKQQK